MKMNTRNIISSLVLVVFLLFTILTLDALAVTGTMPAVENGKITLTEDVTLTEGFKVNAGTNLTLDLAGHTLRTTTGLAADTITVEKGATLTITGNGTITNSYNADNYAALFNNGTVIINGANLKLDTTANSNTYYVVVNHGTMTVENATMTSNDNGSSMFENGYSNYSSGNSRSGYVASVNQENPKLTIERGTYNGGMNTIKNDDGAEVVINGGTFQNTVQVSLMNWNKATINGGTFKTPTGNDKTNIFVGSFGANTQDKGILVINGGNFEAEYLLEGYQGITTPVKINGGKINVTKGIVNDNLKPDGAPMTHDTLVDVSGIDIVGEVTAPASALKYAKSGATLTIRDDLDIGTKLDVPTGVTVFVKSSDSDKEVVKNEDGSTTVKYKDADYSEVEELIVKVNGLNPNLYKDFSKVEAAVQAVDYGKNITEQDEVDAYAKAIEEAIAGLEKKDIVVDNNEEETEPSTNEEEEVNNPQTSDNVLTFVTIGLVAVITLAGVTIYKKQK